MREVAERQIARVDDVDVEVDEVLAARGGHGAYRALGRSRRIGDEFGRFLQVHASLTEVLAARVRRLARIGSDDREPGRAEQRGRAGKMRNSRAPLPSMCEMPIESRIPELSSPGTPRSVSPSR